MQNQALRLTTEEQKTPLLPSLSRDKLLKAMSFKQKLNTLIDPQEIKQHLIPELERRLGRPLPQASFYSLLLLIILLPMLVIGILGAIASYFRPQLLSLPNLASILEGASITWLITNSLVVAPVLALTYVIFKDSDSELGFYDKALVGLISACSGILHLGSLVLAPVTFFRLNNTLWTFVILSLAAAVSTGIIQSIVYRKLPLLQIKLFSPYLGLALPVISSPSLLLAILTFNTPAPLNTRLIGCAMILPLLVVAWWSVPVVYIRQVNKKIRNETLTSLKRLIGKSKPQPLLAMLIAHEYDYSRFSWKQISSEPLVAFLLQQGGRTRLIDEAGAPYLENTQYRRAAYVGRCGRDYPSKKDYLKNGEDYLKWRHDEVSPFFAELGEIYGWDLFKIDQKKQIPIVELTKEIGKGAINEDFSSPLSLEHKAENEEAQKKLDKTIAQLDSVLMDAWKEQKEPGVASRELMRFDDETLKIFPQSRTVICKTLLSQANAEISRVLAPAGISHDLSKLICSFFFPVYKDTSVEENSHALEFNPTRET